MNYYKTKIRVFHENELKRTAKANSLMKLFNVELLSLNGKIHPVANYIYTDNDFDRAIPHIQMLSGIYYTYSLKAKYKGGSNKCPFCTDQKTEDIKHILLTHQSVKMKRILCEIQLLCDSSVSIRNFVLNQQNEDTQTQFLIDPTSISLEQRISFEDPLLEDMIRKCRDYTFVTHIEKKQRIHDLSNL